MKIFNNGDKVNFVDENNVFVGYDLRQHCCEHADYFFAHVVTKDLPEVLWQTLNLETYRFDQSFFEEIDNRDALDDGGMVVFKLLSTESGNPTLFLHLFNCQNGYYGHGFTMEIDGKLVRYGVL